MINIEGRSIQVLNLESILEHKLQTLSKASATTPVDPKHMDDARLLGSLLRRGVPEVSAPALAKDVYGGEADMGCRRCELSRHPGFPLAPRRHVFAILDWSGE